MEINIVGAASPRHSMQMKKLAEFCGAYKIEYKDLYMGEDYIMTKKDQSGMEVTFTLHIGGNRVDGGFLSLDLP